MDSFTITMIFDKATQNTVRFAAEDPEAPVSMVYMKKSAFPNPDEPPQRIALTIANGDAS